MRLKGLPPRIACLRVFTVMAMALLLSLMSCRHATTHGAHDAARRATLDSLMAGITVIDSLEARVHQFHQQQDNLGEMIALKHMGRRLRGQARYEQAIEVHNRGLDAASRLADTLEMCEFLNNLGMCKRCLGDMSAANGHHYQSLELLDHFSDQDSDEALRIKAYTLNGIGVIEGKLFHYTLADSLLREAMNFELMVTHDDLGVSVNACELGKIKMEQGQTDSASHYLQMAMEYSKHVDFENGTALVHLYMGELHEKERRFYHAVADYRMAYDIFKRIGDSWLWQMSCLALARVSVLLNEQADAISYLNEVETEAIRTGCKENLAEAHSVHYELSLLQGNTQAALQHYIMGNELYDSIYGLKKGEEMRKQRIRYQNGVKSNKMDVLNRDITHLKHLHNMQLWLALLLLAMSVAVIAALVYVVRERMRTQRVMKQIEETRSLFFTNVVHRLRTPMTAIMGAIDRITADADAQGAANEPLRENARLIERQGKNLLTLVDRILEVGSVRSAVSEFDWATGDAVTYLRMLIDTYREQCVAHHIELIYAPSENYVVIDTVPRYIDTIVRSLIENAINYSRDFSQITFTSHVEEGFFVIRVTDNGMGISPEDLPHVFEPFYRGAMAEQMQEGVGMGLTVVRDMAMALGGTAEVDSVQGQGSVFTVKLPCRQRKEGFKNKLNTALAPLQATFSKSPKHEQVPENDTTQDAGNQPVILVVEDNADVARLVGMVLGKDYTVYYAPDGERGLAMVCERVPDLIITDVKMPLMDGYEFTRKLRSSESLRHIPIIILSARTSDEARVKGIKAGANAYVVKPFVAEELLAWVANLLQQRELMGAGVAKPAGKPVKPVTLPGNDQQNADKDRFLEKFAQAVEDQMTSGEKIDLDKIALSFKMGESQLKHKIHQFTGKSVTAYITQLRMEKALRLLQHDPNILIGDVAVKCGLSDVAYFSRLFRQYYGKTPTQARNELLK